MNILCTMVVIARAVPSAYFEDLRTKQPDVYAHYVAKTRRHQGVSDPSTECQDYSANQSTQPMWFTGSQCSNASMDLTLVVEDPANSSNKVLRSYKKGQIVPLHCDNVFCPPPPRVDCYKDPQKICGEFPGTECYINQFERTGPWGRSPMRFQEDILPGATVSPPIASNCIALVTYLRDGNGDENEMKAAEETMRDMCGVIDPMQVDGLIMFTNSEDSSLPRLDSFYSAVKGQCVKPQQRGYSCIANRFRNDKNLVYKADGETFERPLFCAKELQCLNHMCVKSEEDVVAFHEESSGVASEGMFCGTLRGLNFACAQGLVCTAAENFLEPSTCVRKRSKSIAYLGPWWNSTNCPTMNGFSNAQLVLTGLKVLMLTYPGELQKASNCQEYWNSSLVKGNHEVLYNYVSALIQNLDTEVLNKDLNGTGEFVVPAFEELWANLMSETLEPDFTCLDDDGDKAVSKVADKKSDLMAFGFQPCYIWSVIHFLTFNQKPQMSESAAEASFGISTWLRRYFSCEDCRSFFDGLVKQPTVGVPNDSNFSREHHAYWWHHAHNLASEHFASVRGGDPWVAQLWNEDFRMYQNPFMMTWEDAQDQWISPWRTTDVSTTPDVPVLSAAVSVHPLLVLVLLGACAVELCRQG